MADFHFLNLWMDHFRGWRSISQVFAVTRAQRFWPLAHSHNVKMILNELNEVFLRVRANDQSGSGDNSPAVALVTAVPVVSASQAKLRGKSLVKLGTPPSLKRCEFEVLLVYFSFFAVMVGNHPFDVMTNRCFPFVCPCRCDMECNSFWLEAKTVPSLGL